jgi:hypothetical protein
MSTPYCSDNKVIFMQPLKAKEFQKSSAIFFYPLVLVLVLVQLGKTAANLNKLENIHPGIAKFFLNWKNGNNEGQNINLNKIVLIQGAFTVVRNPELSQACNSSQ